MGRHCASEIEKKLNVNSYNNEIDILNCSNAAAHKSAVTNKVIGDALEADSKIMAATAESGVQKLKLEKAKVDAEVEHLKAVKAAKEGEFSTSCKASSKDEGKKAAAAGGDVHVEIKAPTCLQDKVKDALKAKLDLKSNGAASLDLKSGELSIKK